MSIDQKTEHELKTVRDTIESVWIAIVLAFVIRAFVVEAFIIPTGSMAPTLLGQHFPMQCDACGYGFAFGPVEGDLGGRGYMPARCPGCGNSPSRAGRPCGGDRVLVLKYVYNFSQPQRWDVVVFKNPQNNRDNYIKRLVGLPGETLEIVHGDVFVKSDAANADFEVQRKPKVAQDAMWQIVHNNDYPPDMTAYRRIAGDTYDPPKWVAAGNGWDLKPDRGRVFDFKGASDDATVNFKAPKWSYLPTYGYNVPIKSSIDSTKDVVTDMKLSLVMIPKGPQKTTLMLGLTSFEHEFRGEVSTDGTACLSYRRSWQTKGKWVTMGEVANLPPMEHGKGYTIAITHADLEATLWVDDKPVARSDPKVYRETYKTLRSRMADVGNHPIPEPQISISARGDQCQLRHIAVMRDVFYTRPQLSKEDSLAGECVKDYFNERFPDRSMHDPGWGGAGDGVKLRRNDDKPDFDEFFMLGDNSPMSSDGRAWTAAAYSQWYGKTGDEEYHLGTVPRYNLIGKAMFVYWPAGFRIGDFPPIIPNIGRMRVIH